MQLPPIFVINLKKSIDRRSHIVSQLSAIGYDFRFIEAVDGEILTNDDLQIYSREETLHNRTNKYHRELSIGEIGCVMSHLEIYKTMVNEEIEEAIVLEDDAIIKPEFVEIIKRRQNFPDDWMIVWLCHESQFIFSKGAPTSFRNKIPLNKGYKLARFVEYPWVGAGYLIKRQAAEMLLNFAYPIRMPADILLSGNCGELEIKLYGIEPPCITQFKKLQSQIGQKGRSQLEKKHRLKTVSILKRLKIFHFMNSMRLTPSILLRQFGIIKSVKVPYW